ncbi:Bacterial membrane flanked domain protein [Corynebacterium faecale]|nr:Bacterial membrane flanked domain protein [Corynebacterium faecale]
MVPMNQQSPEPHEGMNPVSPNLTKARYLGRLPWLVLGVIGFAVPGVMFSPWFHIGTAIMVMLLIWQAWLIPQQVKRLGWLETGDELLITKGRLWHTYTVVPYGRIQYVDVTAGPIERALGMKTVNLNTASASSDSSVQGIPAEVADALRDRLAIKARERMSGL